MTCAKFGCKQTDRVSKNIMHQADHSKVCEAKISAKTQIQMRHCQLNTTASLVASWLVCQVSQNESHTTRPGSSQWMLWDQKTQIAVGPPCPTPRWRRHTGASTMSALLSQFQCKVWSQRGVRKPSPIPYIERVNCAIGEWAKSNTMMNVQLSLKLSFAATMSQCQYLFSIFSSTCRSSLESASGRRFWGLRSNH